MKVMQVEYRRRVTLPAGYGMQTFGGIADVQEGETAEQALGRLREWVETQFVGHEVAARVHRALDDQIQAQHEKLADIADRRDRAERRFARLIQLLKDHGVDTSDLEEKTFDDPDRL